MNFLTPIRLVLLHRKKRRAAAAAEREYARGDMAAIPAGYVSRAERRYLDAAEEIRSLEGQRA